MSNPIHDFPLARPWTTRRLGECAFPVPMTEPNWQPADQLSCCRKTKAGKTYCTLCQSVMFLPPEKRKKGTTPVKKS